MVEIAIARNGERLTPPFSEEDLQRVGLIQHLPHRRENCRKCEKRAKEIENENDLTQIMDRAESAIKKYIGEEIKADRIIEEMRRQVDEVVQEDLSDMYKNLGDKE